LGADRQDLEQGRLRRHPGSAAGAQILTWDRREEFNKHIGLYWCLVNGGVTSPQSDPTYIDRFNRLAELDSVDVLAGGDPIDPGDEDVGGAVGYGTLDTTDDRYTRDTEW
jgi:hypothetical protein